MATLLNRIGYASDAGGASSSTTPKVAAAINAAFGRASCGVSKCYLFIGGDTYSPVATAANMLHYDTYLNSANISASRTIMTPGNHDNGSGGSLPDNAAWKAYNNTKGTLTKTNGAELGSSGEGIPNTDQFLDIGGIRWFFINSGAINGGNATPGWPTPHSGAFSATNARVVWLRNNWAPGLKNVMVTHHPRWSYRGDHHDNPNMQNLVNECVGHTPFWISGHDHNMQIFQPQLAAGTYPGLRAVVVGLCATGPYTGAAGSGQTSQKSWLQFANFTAGASGFMQVDVFDDGTLSCTIIDASDTTGKAMTNTSSGGSTGAATFSVATGGGTPIDTTPPSTATLSAGTPTQGTVPLTLSATDNAGVSGFDVEVSPHGANTFVNIGTNVPSPFTATALTAATAYDFRAKAVDTSGNRSILYSTIVSATTAAGSDVTAPTVPASVTATAAGTSQVNLTWAASTDSGGSGLAGYHILRGGVVVRTVGLVTSFSDTGLSPGTTYTYTITAFDNAGNVSAPSSPHNATTAGTSTITYSYNLDGAGFVSLGAQQNLSLTGLVPGVHYLQIERIDSLNGTSDISSYAWVTPAGTPHAPTISGAVDGNGGNITAGGSTTAPDLTFTITGDPGTTLTATLDGVNVGTVASPYKVTVALGTHTIVFKSVNGGVTGPTTSFTWTRTQSGTGNGSGTYQKQVVLPGGILNVNVPEQIWVRAIDTNGVATVTKRNVTLALTSSSNVSLELAEPSDGAVVQAGDVNLVVNADASVTSVQATLDQTAFVPLTQSGPPVSGIQTWIGIITIPTDGSFAVINVIGTDGTTTFTDQATVSFGTVVIPPTGTPAPLISAIKTVEFQVVHVDHGGADIAAFAPNVLTGSFPLNDAGSISYSLPVSSPASLKTMSDPDLFDWRLVRNGVDMFGGPLDTVSIDTAERSIGITGKTWEAYLAQRMMPWDPTKDISQQFKTYTNRDVLDMVRLLLDYVLSGANSIDLTYAPTKSGIVYSNQFDPSALNDLLTIVQTLAEQEPGFDFDIDVNVRMNFYVPKKGSVSDLSLVLDSNAISIEYTDEGILGNHVIGSGSSSQGATVYRNANDASSQAEKRIIDVAADFGTVLSQAAVTSATKTALALAKQKQREFTVRVDPQGENYWEQATVGDQIKVIGDTYYEQLNGYHRCTEMGFEFTEGNKEIMLYTFAPNTIGDNS